MRVSLITAAPLTPLDRFKAKAKVVASGCHLWTGSKTPAGYAQFRVDGRTHYAHRWIWAQVYGPIPDGLTIDHLCRHRRCVNPEHMELVTQRENVLRGHTIPARHAEKTACLRGHPFDAENTYIAPKSGQRQCRICNRMRNQVRGRRAVA